MQLTHSFFNDRKLWVYYSLFFSGCLVLVYQAKGWTVLGDSVNFLCLLFLVNSLQVRRFINILENAFLVTMGYILPLLIRNSLKLSYAEAASVADYIKLALVSSATTIGIGLVFTTLGFLLKRLAQKSLNLRKSAIASAALNDSDNSKI